MPSDPVIDETLLPFNDPATQKLEDGVGVGEGCREAQTLDVIPGQNRSSYRQTLYL